MVFLPPLTPQAIVLLVANLVFLIAVVFSISSVLRTMKTHGFDVTYDVSRVVSALLSYLIVMGLQVYSLNCMVVGDCRVWTWILAGLAVLGTLLYLALLVWIFAKSNGGGGGHREERRPPPREKEREKEKERERERERERVSEDVEKKQDREVTRRRYDDEEAATVADEEYDDRRR